MVVQYKKFLARVIHDVLAKVTDQEGDISRLPPLVLDGKSERMVTLVGKEHLQASSVADIVSRVLAS